MNVVGERTSSDSSGSSAMVSRGRDSCEEIEAEPGMTMYTVSSPKLKESFPSIGLCSVIPSEWLEKGEGPAD